MANLKNFTSQLFEIKTRFETDMQQQNSKTGNKVCQPSASYIIKLGKYFFALKIGVGIAESSRTRSKNRYDFGW